MPSLPFACLLHVELVEYVGSHSRGGCGRHRHDRNAGKILPQLTQLLVVWAEVVSPLADAVGLVNHKPGQFLTIMQVSESGY